MVPRRRAVRRPFVAVLLLAGAAYAFGWPPWPGHGGGAGSGVPADALPPLPPWNATVYVRYPANLTTGGPASLHAWHAALLAAGYASLMSGCNVAGYGADFPGMRPLDAWPPPLLAPGDVIVVAEHIHKQPANRAELLGFAARGVRVLVAVLGLPVAPQKIADAARGWATLVPLTRRMNEQLSVVLPGGLTRPMQPRFYAFAERCRAGKPLPGCGGRGCPEKKDLVVVDSDTVSLPDFDSRIREPIKALRTPAVEVVTLKDAGKGRRLNITEIACLYSRAKVYLDAGFPGFERGPMEAAMLGAVPVVPNAKVPGVSFDEDIPVPREYRADFADPGEVLRVVGAALDASDRGIWTLANPVAARAWHLRAAWPSTFARWAAGLRLHFIVRMASLDRKDADATLATVLALALHYPLFTVHLAVPSVEAFLASPAAALLEQCNLLNSTVLPTADPSRLRTAMPAGSAAFFPPPGFLPASHTLFPRLLADSSLRGSAIPPGLRVAEWRACGGAVAVRIAYAERDVPAGAAIALPDKLPRLPAGPGSEAYLQGGAGCGWGSLDAKAREGVGGLMRDVPAAAAGLRRLVVPE
ncbi:hypothetical protein DFJ74DRAFT_768029 [Hyaloraphidium curvatum]|nr:hypothetical protein DFJ74DRAFT_768029 [Hyaloraphidium curvatum]